MTVSAAKRVKVSFDGDNIIVKFFTYNLVFDKLNDAARFQAMIKDQYFLFLMVNNSFIIPRINYKIRLAEEDGSLELQIFTIYGKIELKFAAVPLIKEIPLTATRMELHEIDRLIKEVKNVVNAFLDNK